MSLDLRDCTFFGPALPEPFVKLHLEAELNKRSLLPKAAGDERRTIQDRWEVYRRALRALGEQGGDRRVATHVLEPLAERLGYQRFEREAEVITREGPEDGGWLFAAREGRVLRAWAVGLGTDLDAPSRRGRAYRFSPSRVAQRVLLAKNERVGLLTDGEELRLLLCDPARPDSHVAIRLDRAGGWRAAGVVPDSYRLLLALASPAGVAALPDLAEAARLAQSTVTKKLRLQARHAVESFLQELLDHPDNAAIRAEWQDPEELARALWREALILVYRLLFVFKLESSADPARAFSFAATSLWRNTYSPNTALAPLVRKVLDQGAESGGFLEGGLRALWRMFAGGMSSSELEIKALGGMLFGEGATPLVDRLRWGERAVARLLDALLWTPGDGKTERERVHYGALDVEDLGRVYEALLELEPGITAEPMCRLRRAKLEVVVPIAQGAPYRTDVPCPDAGEEGNDAGDGEEDDEDVESGEGETPKSRGKSAASGKTKVLFIEEIPAHRFFLRVGLGRKATGSYYTPHPFVRFLVQETLGPQLAERSPKEDPHPAKILELKVLDPAMGSGHFLVEACRYLGEALYEACRLCDELAVQAEEKASKAKGGERERLLACATELRGRVEALPDPEDELVAYLPSRVPEGEESGLSQRKAEALCRRLVVVHCLYGVDKNPLAVELAKLSLWLESYAEGLPLTFLDHRLVCGDSLTGPFFEHLLTCPRSGEKIDDFFGQGLTDRLNGTLAAALVHVRDLEASVGKDVADLEHKRAAKQKLDAALKPLKLLAAAWSGGVMLGDKCDDVDYQALAQAVAKGEDTEGVFAARPRLREMAKIGEEGVPFELAFPEVFGSVGAGERRGFDAVVGNPPWDTVRPLTKEFFASFDLRILNAPSKRERDAMQREIVAVAGTADAYQSYLRSVARQRAVGERLYVHQRVPVGGKLTGGDPDLAKFFAERGHILHAKGGYLGFVLPGAIHSAAGTTGIRRLFLEQSRWELLYSFNNALSLFEVETKVKFALVVVQGGRGTASVRCRFRQRATVNLFRQDYDLCYTRDFIRSTGGAHLAFLELEDKKSVEIAEVCFQNTKETLSRMSGRFGMRFGSECHATNDSWRLGCAGTHDADIRDPDVLAGVLGRGAYVIANEDSIHQYDDHWTGSPRYLIPLSRMSDKPDWAQAGRFYRTMYRRIANIVDLRSMKAVVVPPGWLSASPFADRTPWSAAYERQLSVVGILNTFTLDWNLRLRLTATLNKFIVDALPVPDFNGRTLSLVAHSALRLSCNHAGYAPLWTEQVGDAWREPKPKHGWPVLDGDDVRWAVRAAIDAVVADAYGLDREQYAHVLSTFSHRSYPKAPELCLAAFDELKTVGLDAFTKKHDPYWDIPLNESLPKPVIDLPVPAEHKSAHSSLGPLFDGSEGVEEVKPAKRRRGVKNRRTPDA